MNELLKNNTWEPVKYDHPIGSNGKENVTAEVFRTDAITWQWRVMAGDRIVGIGSTASKEAALESGHSHWLDECATKIEFDLSKPGHGWVRPHPQGVKARCGGPSICVECRAESAALFAASLKLNCGWCGDYMREPSKKHIFEPGTGAPFCSAPCYHSHLGDQSRCTTDGKDPQDASLPGAPGPIDPKSGQHSQYWVLCDAERQKGFVRPVRRSYTHDKCGASTHMGLALCETYARDPGFYGSTFCCGCGSHFPVSEFKWDEDGERLGE